MTTLLILSDMHINHKAGLCPEQVILEDGEIRKQNDGQKWLLEAWNRMLANVKEHAPGDLVTVINGDAVDVDAKGRDDFLITKNEDIAEAMAADLLRPVREMSKVFMMTKGTAAHSGRNHASEAAVARQVKANFSLDRQPLWDHIQLDLDGVKLLFAHHPKSNGGGQPWNRYNVVDAQAARILFEFANSGEVAPQLAIFSHLHQYMDSQQRFFTRAIITPGWELLKTEYMYRLGIAPVSVADVGAVVVMISGGKYEVHTLRFRQPKRIWTLLGEIK